MVWASCPAPCHRPGRRPGPDGAGTRARPSPRRLVGAQRPVETERRRQIGELLIAGQLGQQRRQPAAGLHAIHRQPIGVVGVQCHVERIQQADLAPVALLLPEADPLLDGVGIQHHPFAAHLHQRRFEIGQPAELLGADRLAPHGQLPIELDQRVERKMTRRRRGGTGLALLGPQLEAAAETGGAVLAPPGRHQHAEAAGLQQRGHFAQKMIRLIRGQVRGLRLFLPQAGFDRPGTAARPGPARPAAVPAARRTAGSG